MDSEQNRAIPPGWIIILIAAGVGLLALSSIMPEHSAQERIAESLGEGLMLLGLIDLLLQKHILPYLTRLDPFFQKSEDLYNI